MSDDAGRPDAWRHDASAASVLAPVSPQRPFSVLQSLLFGALLATVVGGLAFQLGLGDTSFDRPGQVVLLFVDVAPVLWFAAAPIIVHALRWRAIDQRLRWVVVAAVVASSVSVGARMLLSSEPVLSSLLDPFTVAFTLWIAAAAQWTRTRVKRLAAGTDRGITIVGMALGFAVAAAGIALGTLRLVLVGPEELPGDIPVASTESPTTALLIAATFAMVAGLFWLTDRTRNR